ncbi:hypothetical protein IGI04_015104 [Brassica rapa subsp. trilocularis]|uniref:UBX domain-containing protein n=1 Tax=Brassica rapa subsp. trilocularis TaxID=1813537 RepID=A0ABQ7MP80_BRACM|nr:hypothetical protein IGI04_015104 [Brassica rapa subsp. trilocularis]
MGITFSRTNRVITTRSQLDEDINNLFLNNESPQTLSTNLIDQQRDDQLISSFLEVAVGQTVETAKRFLETTNWNIDESINLFLLRNNYDPSVEAHAAEQSNESTTFDGGESDSTLASMYRPPVDLLFEGRTFEEAKSTSCTQNLWLLVNLQSRTEFASHALNRNLWSNDTVSEAVMCSFVLWQVYDNTIEGKKISNFYKIDSAPPVVLVIDPVTGQKMGMWSGVIDAQSFVEDLSRFLEAGPHEHVASLIRNRYPETEDDQTCSASNNNDQVPVPSWGEEFEKEDDWSSSKGPSWGEEFENVVETCSSSNNDDGIFEFPDLTEEPKGDCDKSLVCSLCVRFPDGRRKQRKFLKTEPIQLLWSFCHSQIVESEKKTFKLVQAIPGASKTLDYGLYATFEESGLANSMISVLYN